MTTRFSTVPMAVLFLTACSSQIGDEPGPSTTPGDASDVVEASSGGVGSAAGGSLQTPEGSGGMNAGGTGGSTGATGATGGGTGGASNSAGGAAVEEGTGGSSTGGNAATCDAKWLFCDDFESFGSGPAPGGPWSPAGNYGNWDIGVVDDRSFSGSKSAFFSVETTGRAFMTTREPFPIAGNNFFGRYMIYFDDLPLEGVGVHWDIVSALAEDGDDGNYRWGGMWGHMMANYHPGDCWGNANNLVPVTHKWQCIEWQFDGPNDTLHVWLDGEHASIETTGGGCVSGPGDRTWEPPEQFLQLQIGWAHYQNQLNGNQVWIDDVVIDGERIGCPAPL